MSEQVTFSSWLQGIANAIRTKKGTTEPIKPLNFATEIESIETGGSTGGSFSDGQYMKPLANLPVSTTYKCLFSYNDDIYVATGTATGTSNQTSKIYKFDKENNIFNEILFDEGTVVYNCFGYNAAACECNGKVYIINSTSATCWDGSTSQVMERKFHGAGFEVLNGNGFSYNGNIYLVNYRTGKLVQYDFETNTCTTIVEDINTSSYWQVVSNNGNTYILDWYKTNKEVIVYTFDGATYQVIATIGLEKRYYYPFLQDNKIYYSELNSGVYTLYCYDLLTNELTVKPYNFTLGDTLSRIWTYGNKVYYTDANVKNRWFEVFIG